MLRNKGKEKGNSYEHQGTVNIETTAKTISEDLEIASLPCHFNWSFNEEKFKKRLEQNRRSCKTALKQTPDASVTNFLGYLYFKSEKSGEIEKAKHYFKACLEDFPNNPIALANLACFYQKQGRLKKANEYVAQFKETDEQKQRLWTHWCKGYFHVRLFEYNEAIQEYKEAACCAPAKDKPTLYRYQGIYLNRKKRFWEAVQVLEKARALSQKEDASIYLHLGRAYGGLKKQRGEHFKKALFCFEKALQLSPGDENILKFYAKLLSTRKKQNEALRYYNNAIESQLKPTSTAYHMRGKLYQRQKQYAKALSDFKEAVRLKQTNYYAVFDLIATHYAMEQYSKARSKILGLPPNIRANNPQVLYYWGSILDKKGEHESAEQKFLACIHSPLNNRFCKKEANHWLAQYYIQAERKTSAFLVRGLQFFIKSKQWNKARALFEENRVICSEDFELHYLYSQIKINQKHYDIALDSLHDAFSLAKTANDKFKCYRLYCDNEKHFQNKDKKAAFLKDYVAFETAFHKKNDKLFWHHTLNVVYHSKRPDKELRIEGSPIHAALKEAVERQRKSAPSGKGNYVTATLGFIVSKILPKSSQQPPFRLRQFISMRLGKKTDTQMFTHANVFKYYEFSKTESPPRSAALLNDILISKPHRKHAKIKEHYEENKSFHRKFHCSERALFGFLNKPTTIDKTIRFLENRLKCKPGESIKVYAVVLDMHSERFLCEECEESMFFAYHPRGAFMHTFIGKLKEKGHHAHTKSGSIDSIVRVSTQKPTGNPNSFEKPEPHQEQDIEFIKNTFSSTVMLLQRDNRLLEKDTTHTIFKSRR